MRELIMVSDRVLIKPEEPTSQTTSGLYLPDTVRNKERIQSGRVKQVGPGYLLPNPDYSEAEALWTERNMVRYLPLQASVGDFAFFLRKEAIELTFEGEAYLILPHGAILALIRDQPDERELYQNLGGEED